MTDCVVAGQEDTGDRVDNVRVWSDTEGDLEPA